MPAWNECVPCNCCLCKLAPGLDAVYFSSSCTKPSDRSSLRALSFAGRKEVLGSFGHILAAPALRWGSARLGWPAAILHREERSNGPPPTALLGAAACLAASARHARRGRPAAAAPALPAAWRIWACARPVPLLPAPAGTFPHQEASLTNPYTSQNLNCLPEVMIITSSTGCTALAIAGHSVSSRLT